MQLAEILRSQWPELPEDRIQGVLRYYELLSAENERQNLTRLISPEDFFHGHCEDVRALEKSGLIEFPALDLGSGGGVPGLLYAVCFGGEWILSDSEKKKAEFLQAAVDALGLRSVRVTYQRAEEFLRSNRVKSVVARAVGPVERINNWIRACSTWNNLVLLKGPGWEREWEEFKSSPKRNDLAPDKSFAYEVGPEKKQRLIVRLVPRGTRG